MLEYAIWQKMSAPAREKLLLFRQIITQVNRDHFDHIDA